jgi:hypothetical protein
MRTNIISYSITSLLISTLSYGAFGSGCDTGSDALIRAEIKGINKEYKENVPTNEIRIKGANSKAPRTFIIDSEACLGSDIDDNNPNTPLNYGEKVTTLTEAKLATLTRNYCETALNIKDSGKMDQCIERILPYRTIRGGKLDLDLSFGANNLAKTKAMDQSYCMFVENINRDTILDGQDFKDRLTKCIENLNSEPNSAYITKRDAYLNNIWALVFKTFNDKCHFDKFYNSKIRFSEYDVFNKIIRLGGLANPRFDALYNDNNLRGYSYWNKKDETEISVKVAQDPKSAKCLVENVVSYGAETTFVNHNVCTGDESSENLKNKIVKELCQKYKNLMIQP